MDKQRFSLTFGDAGENHIGMEMLGERLKEGEGFKVEDLEGIMEVCKEKGYKCEMIDLDKDLDKELGAKVLIVREFYKKKKIKKIFDELKGLEWDKKYFDRRRGKVLNKNARHNLVFMKGYEQKDDYEKGQGKVYDVDKLDLMKWVKSRVERYINKGIDKVKSKSKKVDYIIEGNNYYSLDKTMIGFHGDSERRRVACVSVGGENQPMAWWWFKNSKAQCDPHIVRLNSGDLYVMSEKAVGSDWRRKKVFTLRHSFGEKGIQQGIKKYG